MDNNTQFNKFSTTLWIWNMIWTLIKLTSQNHFTGRVLETDFQKFTLNKQHFKDGGILIQQNCLSFCNNN